MNDKTSACMSDVHKKHILRPLRLFENPGILRKQSDDYSNKFIYERNDECSQAAFDLIQDRRSCTSILMKMY